MRQSRAKAPQDLKRHIVDFKDLDAMKGVCRICGPINLWQRAEGIYLCENRRRKVKHEHMLTRYGITSEEYERLYAEQRGQCRICREPKEVLHVDHCHDSERVRGLLCGTCNRGIGMFYENPLALRAAADYLEEC